MVDVGENNHAICYIVQEQDFLACRLVSIGMEDLQYSVCRYLCMSQKQHNVIARFGEFSGVSAKLGRRMGGQSNFKINLLGV